MNIDKDNERGCAISESLLRKMSCGCENPSVCGHSCAQGCEHGGWGLKDYPLAMVYSPLQNFCELYDLDEALERGTLFKQLDLLFEGESVVKGGCCRG